MFVRSTVLLAVLAFGCHSHDEVPETFAGMENPLDIEDAAVTAAGQTLYADHCADCHGSDLSGNGPSASGFDPAPPNLIEHAGHHEDDYLLWRMTDGVGTNMPAFSSLAITERWQVISYIRSRIE